MRRYLLDTNAAADYINRRNQVRERATTEMARGNRIGIVVPVLAELWFGVENSATRDRNAQRLTMASSEWTIWPFGIEAAQVYGRLATALRRAGRPMQQIDLMIASVALSLGNCTVVTQDSDLTSVPGLSVENWAMNVGP